MPLESTLYGILLKTKAILFLCLVCGYATIVLCEDNIFVSSMYLTNDYTLRRLYLHSIHLQLGRLSNPDTPELHSVGPLFLNPKKIQQVGFNIPPTSDELLDAIRSSLDCYSHFNRPTIVNNDTYNYGDRPMVVCSTCVQNFEELLDRSGRAHYPYPDTRAILSNRK